MSTPLSLGRTEAMIVEAMGDREMFGSEIAAATGSVKRDRVYQVLAILEDKKLVTSRLVDCPNPRRKYALTALGRETKPCMCTWHVAKRAMARAGGCQGRNGV